MVLGLDVAGGFPEDAAEGPESFGGRVDVVRRLVAGLASIDVSDLSMDELVGVLVPLERCVGRLTRCRRRCCIRRIADTPRWSCTATSLPLMSPGSARRVVRV